MKTSLMQRLRRKRKYRPPFSEMSDVVRMEFCRDFVDDVSFPMTREEKALMERMMYQSIVALDGKAKPLENENDNDN